MRIENTEIIKDKLAEFGLVMAAEFDLPDDTIEAARRDCVRQFLHVSDEECDAIAIARVVATLAPAPLAEKGAAISATPPASSPETASGDPFDLARVIELAYSIESYVRKLLFFGRAVIVILALLLLLSIVARADDKKRDVEIPAERAAVLRAAYNAYLEAELVRQSVEKLLIDKSSDCQRQVMQIVERERDAKLHAWEEAKLREWLQLGVPKDYTLDIEHGRFSPPKAPDKK